MIKLSSGRTLSFEQYGDPAGIPVIAFHGTPGSRLALQVVSEAAKANNLRVIAVDRPGYGRSDPMSRPSFSLYMNDIFELADTLSVDKFIAWGTSGGGPFALACAAILPKRVISVGIVSGIGPLSNRQSIREMIAANRMMFSISHISPELAGFIISRMIKASLPGMKEHVRNRTSPSENISPGTFAIIQADQEEAIQNGGKGICFDMTLLWHKWDFALADIKAPVHIWHGEKDNLAPPELARFVAANVPNAKLVMYSGEDHVGPITRHMHEIMQTLRSDAT
jgi:pimeloyl-ACP methyl ester carboxylesterase